MIGMVKWYTVYDRKTDDILAYGTIGYCQRKLGFKTKASFLSTLTHCKDGRCHKYDYLVEELPTGEAKQYMQLVGGADEQSTL